ncbi:MAG: beta-ketoacyl synthase N-terminal-like domain-containing protein [Desulfuromonadaceae bacterium]|nr:beta-ketoacyl synthase N-terminal-like domain-containing protein [Desulfuromonadaceae bacterium]
MREVCISAAHTVTGLGPDLDSLWRGVMAGESAIRPLTRFATDRYLTGNASWIEGLESKSSQSRLYPLLEQLFDGFVPVPAGTTLITASTKGCIDGMERLQMGLPGDPAEVPMAPLLQHIAGRLGMTASGININAACASSTIAVARAASLIAAGRSESVVVVCMDLVSEFVFSGFSALQALSRTACRPFDRNRDGLILGEGGAALLLMSREQAIREGWPVLGVVSGWGSANDATHITAPARDGCGLIQSVRQALKRAAIAPAEIAAISAHGTATVYNDLMELIAFRTLFGERSIPMHSIKGAIGHTLGAAGGIEVALGLKCLEAGQLPPTVGLLEPEEAGEGFLSCSAEPIDGRYLLSTNSGFGGVNAALILRREEG